MNSILVDNHPFFYYESDDIVVSYLKQGYLYGKNNYDIGLIYSLDPNGYIIDCGAHIGTFGFKAALDSRKILMLEAAIKNVECLQQTFNNFSNVIIEQCILLDSIRSCGFSENYGPYGYVKNIDNGNQSSCTLDSICSNKNIDSISIIKYDLEGYEIEALLGSTRILSQYKPLLILEINGHCLRIRNKTPFDAIDTLEKLNYLCFFRNKDNSLIRIDKYEKFPFCVMDIICIHKENIIPYIGRFQFLNYMNHSMIQNIIKQNLSTANNDCIQYFNTLLSEK